MEQSGTIQQVTDANPAITNTEAQTPPHHPMGHGLVVAAPPMRLLYMDRAALSLFMDMSAQERNGLNRQLDGARESLLNTVAPICTHVFQRLHKSSQGIAREPVEVRRLHRSGSYSLRVRAFGTSGNSESTHVVLLLDQIGHRQSR